MTKLDRAKQVIRDNYREARCGIYDCRNLVGDPMQTIYYDGDLQIDICYYYMYFEVFGLSGEDFAKLEKYYVSLVG